MGALGGCEILAELTLDERVPDRSGRRLIEWAAQCGASGVILRHGSPAAGIGMLRDEARRYGLRWYVELPPSDRRDDPEIIDADGVLVREPTWWSPTRLGALRQRGVRILAFIGHEPGPALDGWGNLLDPSHDTVLYTGGGGGDSRARFAPMRELARWGGVVGYCDNGTDPWWCVLGVLAGARVVLKGLTLNRSLGGPAHRASLYPHEFQWMVERIRQHETLPTDPGELPTQMTAWEPAASTFLEDAASLVAARFVKAGEALKREDLAIVPGLRGLSSRMEPRVLGRRLIYDRQPGDPITFGMLDPWADGMERPPLDMSVVIRSKNEGFWLRRCLSALVNQQAPPREIVVVDNESSDDTRAIASSFGCRLMTIRDGEFSFGRALNRGIAAARGAWVVSLSAHCIPLHDWWLAAFSRECTTPFVAAVYGKQEPLPETSDLDKRDLWITFGEERRVQQGQDYFFHNANSLIRRATWESVPFDEDLNGVEDRDWAKKVLAEGYQIVYTPLASVHHYHGIHQGRNEARARRVVKVIELIQQRRAAESSAS